MKREHVIHHFIKKYKVRLALCGVLIASLYVTPALTQAQYKWTLNGYSILQASEFYFDGNYMHDIEDASYYQTTGWDGETRALPEIEIRNYDNALLANKKGEDIYYKMNWSIETYDEHGNKVSNTNQMYSLTVSKSNSSDAQGSGSIDSNENIATGAIAGDENGTPKKDSYTITINKPTGLETIPEGYSVQIKLHAINTDASYQNTSTSFQRELGCTFQYVVSTASSYVKAFDPSDKAGSTDVSVTLGTGTIPGMDAQQQTVTVWWNEDALEINPFNMTFSEMSSSYTKTTVNGHTYGQITITGLGSNANRILGFYKKAYNGKSDTDFWFANTEEIERLRAKNKQPGDEDNAILGYYVKDNSQKGTQ